MARSKLVPPAEPAQQGAETVYVVAVEPIRHDGVDQPVGAAIEVSPEAAAALIANGAARAAVQP